MNVGSTPGALLFDNTVTTRTAADQAPAAAMVLPDIMSRAASGTGHCATGVPVLTTKMLEDWAKYILQNCPGVLPVRTSDGDGDGDEAFEEDEEDEVCDTLTGLQHAP